MSTPIAGVSRLYSAMRSVNNACDVSLSKAFAALHSGDSEGSADHDSGRDCALPMVMMGNSAAELMSPSLQT